jgi:hypothetical protein
MRELVNGCVHQGIIVGKVIVVYDDFPIIRLVEAVYLFTFFSGKRYCEIFHGSVEL